MARCRVVTVGLVEQAEGSIGGRVARERAASAGSWPHADLLACEKAAAAAGRMLGDVITRHPMTADHLISVVLRLYRQGDDNLRRRCPAHV
jgi:hypothetical protein